MKVWETIAELNGGEVQIFTDNCPSGIEEKYQIIGERRFKRHCDIGCGVECTKEYLDLEIKK
jgi:hypothetical protein